MAMKLPARDRNFVGRGPNHFRSPFIKSNRTRQYGSAVAKA